MEQADDYNILKRVEFYEFIGRAAVEYFEFLQGNKPRKEWPKLSLTRKIEQLLR